MAIRLHGLGREFDYLPVLRDVSVELAAGQTLCVLGANGSGKTTLLRICAGLLRPSTGSVEVLGCELPREAWALRGRVGVLGHQALLYTELTALENLQLAARLHGIADPGARIAELLEAVGLAHRARARVGEMSIGMTQRLALCRAILHEPELLLLDEPLSHLDPGAEAALAPLLGPAEGRTRVLVTHDPDAGLRQADAVLALARDGSVAYCGAPAGFDAELRAAVYGGARPAVTARGPG